MQSDRPLWRGGLCLGGWLRRRGGMETERGHWLHERRGRGCMDMTVVSAQMCRFAILNCEDNPAWNITAKQKRPNLEGHGNRFVEMFMDAFGEADDQWKAFSCYDGEWPTIEEASEQFDAVFITGSTHTAYDPSLKWVPELCEMLELYAQAEIRVVGICFGAQVLAMALGGRVGKNPGGFYAKVEELEVLPVFSPLIGTDVKTRLPMIECHGDQVLELPGEAVRLATSKSCTNEVWCCRTVLAIQCHPEFIPNDIIKNILPRLKQRRLLSLAQVIQNEKNIRSAKLAHKTMRDFVKQFTRDEDFMLSHPYRELFPARLNSHNDAVLVHQIEKMTKKMAEEPFTSSNATQTNPDLDAETKELVQDGVKQLTDQFSTLMLKELKRAMIDYRGVQMGNAVVHEHAKTLLRQAMDLHQPIKELRMERAKMTEEVNRVLEDVSEMIQSLEVSAHLLEQQTWDLRQRIAPAN